MARQKGAPQRGQSEKGGCGVRRTDLEGEGLYPKGRLLHFIAREAAGAKGRRVTGDRDRPMWQGYTCVKGRALPEQHYHPERLLHSQKRLPDGTFWFRP